MQRGLSNDSLGDPLPSVAVSRPVVSELPLKPLRGASWLPACWAGGYRSPDVDGPSLPGTNKVWDSSLKPEKVRSDLRLTCDHRVAEIQAALETVPLTDGSCSKGPVTRSSVTS